MSKKDDLINTSIDKITFVIEYNKKKIQRAAYGLLVYIKNIICCKTDVAYFTSDIIIYSNSIEFSVKIEEHNERLDKLSLINKRIESIKNNIKKYKITNKIVLSYLRTLITNGYNPDELLYIHYSIGKDNFYEYIPINYSKIPEIKINSKEYSNIGVKHIHIYNPFIDECGIFVDESKTLKDFIGYGPNHLHYYEHLVGELLWTKDYEGLFKFSAFTSIVGICICYLIDKEEVCKDRLINYIKGRNNISKGIMNLKLLKLEKQRVVSETYNDRFYNNPFRINGDDYNHDTFDLKVFQYYASLNYTIVTISNHKYKDNPFTNIISELNNKLKINKIKSPEIKKYKHFTFFRSMSYFGSYRMYYKDLPKNFKLKYKYIAGVDSVLINNKYPSSSPLNIITALSHVSEDKYDYIAKYKIKHVQLNKILDNTYDLF